MYSSPGFQTKKALKEAVAAGLTVTVYQPGGLFGVPIEAIEEGRPLTVEGPSYKPHSWYASVKVDKSCRIISVK